VADLNAGGIKKAQAGAMAKEGMKLLKTRSYKGM
jgi:hypothetical protein